MKYCRVALLGILLVGNFIDAAYRLGGEITIQRQLQKPFIETSIVFISAICSSLGIMLLWRFALNKK